jgi:ribosomal RNA-processing protein 8
MQYHSGFRSQASNWPVNPLSVISNNLLSSLPAGSLVADFGCGDAGLARTLCPSSSSSASGPSLKLKLAQPKLVAQKALKVVSFDLVSQNPYVIEAECSSVPLPGSSTTSEGQVVDAVVCCLSLMGTDWINVIREARRVLRGDGKLLIAEVSSRFEKVDEFVKLVESVGFESTGKVRKHRLLRTSPTFFSFSFSFLSRRPRGLFRFNGRITDTCLLFCVR